MVCVVGPLLEVLWPPAYVANLVEYTEKHSLCSQLSCLTHNTEGKIALNNGLGDCSGCTGETSAKINEPESVK